MVAASTLQATNYGDGTNSLTFTELLNGIPLQWWTYDGLGTGHPVTSGFNVSDSTDNGVGNSLFEFTNNWSDGSHAAMSSYSYLKTSGNTNEGGNNHTRGWTTTQVRCKTINSGGAAIDATYGKVAIIRGTTFNRVGAQ